MENSTIKTVSRSQVTYPCVFRDLGLVDYQKAYRLQKECVDRLLDGGSQTLLICEHPAVLTLGRLTDPSNLLVSREELEQKRVNVFPIDRGGDVTLHSPGQMVMYPIFRLENYGKDLRKYLNRLEKVIIDLLGGFGVESCREPGQTGVWVGKDKIASIGIGVKRWVSFHGVGVNINTDLECFDLIKPCGLNVRMTSLKRIKQRIINMDEVKEKLRNSFCKNFNLSYIIESR